MSDVLTAPDRARNLTVDSGKYLRAARGETLSVPPVWLMRQAGRYLPEYRAVRVQHDFITVCRTPELACEVTLQPIRRFQFDAAILFSDILIPAIPLGAGLQFDSGHGPVIPHPVRTGEQVQSLRDFDPQDELADVLEAVTLLRRELPSETALIGFCGAPYTVATYLIEGGKPDPFKFTKQMMYGDRAAFTLLLDKLANMTIRYLRAQVQAGADAIQLFDTWAGNLTDDEFRTVNLPVLRRIFTELSDLGVPMTYFALNSMHLVSACEAGASVYGLDWRMTFDQARARFGTEVALQGNLDPILLLTDETTIRNRTREIRAQAGPRGHIFNLGHGILPSTPIHNVEVLLDEIRGGRQ